MNLYGVYFGSKWGLTTNRTQALKVAKQEMGTVRVLRNAYAYGSPSAWDAPTFRVTSDLLQDYRRDFPTLA